jgi:monomeric sarcosine oxidase
MASAHLGYECVVVGGGIVGVATAWRAARRGLRTLLLERFADDAHDRGSSHGESRIIRRTYAQDHFTEAMGDAYRLWAEAEAEDGARVIRTTGGLDMGPVGNPGLAALVAGCRRHGVAHERPSAAEVARRFPLFRPPEDYEYVYSAEAGVVHADHARAMLLRLAVRAGCELRAGARVVEIERADGGARGALRVALRLGGDDGPVEHIETDACVLAAGPWAPSLLRRCAATARTAWAGLPLRPQKVRAQLWTPRAPDARALVARCPVFIDYSPEAPIYGMPDPSGLLKVASHVGPYFADADARDDQDDAATALTGVRPFIERVLPSIDWAAGPTRVQHCAYTMTPDEGFVLDAMAVGGGRLVLGAACSGHGFKLAPWVGEALAALAAPTARLDAGEAAEWARRLAPFRADRTFGSFEAPHVFGQRSQGQPS